MKGGRGKEEWKWVKNGREVGRLPTIDRSTNSRRPVDERIVGKTNGGKKREKKRGKRWVRWGLLGYVRDAKGLDLR